MKDYYLILGVDRKASQKEIKDAYRKLVLRHHPDRAPETDQERFLEIQEAYETLGDQQRRRRYNEELERYERVRSGVEPVLLPRPISGGALLEELFSPLDEFFAYLEESLFGGGFRREPSAEKLHVEIELSRGEARSGGILPLDIPLRVVCSACGGTGRRGLAICPHCRGTGELRRSRSVNIEIPAGVQDGSVFALPLEEIGLYGTLLILHFRIT